MHNKGELGLGKRETVHNKGELGMGKRETAHNKGELGMEVGKVAHYIYLSLHCHHQNDSCIKMGSGGSPF